MKIYFWHDKNKGWAYTPIGILTGLPLPSTQNVYHNTYRQLLEAWYNEPSHQTRMPASIRKEQQSVREYA